MILWVTIYVSHKRHVWSSLPFFSPSFPLKGPPHYLTLCHTFWLLIWRKTLIKISPSSHYPKKVMTSSFIHPSIHLSIFIHDPSFFFTILISQTAPIVAICFGHPSFFLFVPISFSLYGVGLFLKPIFVCMFMFVRVSPLSCCHWGGAWLGVCLCGLGIWPQECFTGFHSSGFLFDPNFVHLGFLGYFFVFFLASA